jgi:hypothetical protein
MNESRGLGRNVSRDMTGLQSNENPIYVFLFWELRGLSPNIHVSVSDLYNSRIGPHIGCSKIDGTDPGKI